MRILGICGGLQAESTNLDLLRLAQAAAEDEGGKTEVVLFDGLRDLEALVAEHLART